MKTLQILSVLVCLLLITTLAYAQSDDDPAVVEYIVTGEIVNLRAGPGTNFEIIGEVVRGESIFAYAADEPQGDWTRLYRGPDVDDAYIASFLVTAAPPRYYPAEQAATQRLNGVRSAQQGPFAFEGPAYRVDVIFEGRNFALEAVATTGECADIALLDIATPNGGLQSASTFMLTGGCAWVFQVSDATSTWSIEFRDLLDETAYAQSLIDATTQTTLNGTGTQFTFPVSFTPGDWQLTATVQDRSFILQSVALEGDCGLPTLVFNNHEQNANSLTLLERFTVGAEGCVVYWQTDNVDTEWTLNFAPITPEPTPTAMPTTTPTATPTAQ